LQIRSKRELGTLYQTRYKEVAEDLQGPTYQTRYQGEGEDLKDVFWDKEYELEEEEEEEEEVNSSEVPGSSTSRPDDDLLADAELKSVLSLLLHNDTDFSTMNENVFVMYLRLMELEADLNRSVAALTQLGSSTPEPLYTSTVQTYVRGNSGHNVEINALLNRLLQLRVTKGLTYLDGLKESASGKAVRYSDNAKLDSEVKQIFARLMVFGRLYNISFKNYLASLEAMPPVKEVCPYQKAWISMICLSKFLAGLRNEIENQCCSLSSTSPPRTEL